MLLAVVLLTLAGTAAGIQYLRIRSAESKSSEELVRKFDRAHEAMVSFVTLVGRLPCPANPAADTGLAAPDSAAVTCTNSTGTLPWRSLGLRRDDALDTWGRKISYRVFTGSTTVGSLTQANGASMVDCDPSEDEEIENVTLGSGGGCKGNKKTHPGPVHPNPPKKGFLTDKGFTVDNFGVSETNVAYVLISHGRSGYGGYTTASTQLTMPSSTKETANTSPCGNGCVTVAGIVVTPGTFYAAAESASTVAADDAAHFDDLISYKTSYEVVTRAGRGARAW